MVGLVIVVIVLVALLVNAFYMLLSPSAWFRLPRWLGVHGQLTKEKYGGERSIEIRVLGAIVIAGILWVVYDFISRR